MSYLGDLGERVERKISSGIYARTLDRQTRRIVRGDEAAAAYSKLNPASLCLDAATFHATDGPPRINLFLPSAQKRHRFAGALTALRTAAQAAAYSGRKLCIVTFEHATRADRTSLLETLEREFNLPPDQVSDICPAAEASRLRFHDDDVWIATMWNTAHCLDVLAVRGKISRDSVLYLVQDYEPMFLPAGTESSLARATYHAEFTMLVNSQPLADFLQENEKAPIDATLVFAPELDFPRLRAAAAKRRPNEDASLLVYYRPHSARNMTNLAMSAVHQVALIMERDARPFRIATMGRSHPPMMFGSRTPVTSLGRLPWSDYFDHLTRYQVVLSLQATPHPSHPPLDMVASGGIAVTNDVGGQRSHLHPRMLAVLPDPRHLAEAVISAFENTESQFDDIDPFMRSLGRPYHQALASALTLMRL